ncbi:hypothetical protein [Alicyclobacillus acidiphilus]|uniref:hypothetical protein n=1 Tax=Alicyclobacillus acidiphilus TaxID=182455 RepID=UPI00082DD4C6|nr:hypothetical protein [Alicyclobacillus acidiphilus]
MNISKYVRSVPIAILTLSTVGGIAFSSQVAMAGTTSISDLEQTITTDQQLIQSSTGQSLASGVLSIIQSPTFNWNEVLFGTDAPSAWQQQVAVALKPDLESLVSFSSVNASDLVTSIVTTMTTLNPSVQESDVVGFLSSIVNNAVTIFGQLQGETAIQAAETLHADFVAYMAPYANIQAIFSASGPSASSGSAGVGGAVGGASGGGDSGAATTPTVPVGSGNAFSTLLQTLNVTSAAQTFQVPVSGANVTINVPAGAFSQPETISVVSGTASDLSSLLAANASYATLAPLATFGVSFSGAAPTVPITITVTSSHIPAGAQVLKVNADGSLTPVQATVAAGQVTLSITSDPDFVIAAPNTTDSGSGTTSSAGTSSGAGSNSMTGIPKGPTPSWKGYLTVEIDVNGVPKYEVPGLVHGGTTYVPIWYAMKALNAIGFTNTWSGSGWGIQAPAQVNPDYSNLKIGTGVPISLDGKVVEKVPTMTAIDPTSKKKTTYMPIWYVMQALDRAKVTSNWKSPVWTLNFVAGMTNQPQ